MTGPLVMNILFMPVEMSALNNVALSGLNYIVNNIVCCRQCSMLLITLNNSLKIHEKNTKKVTAVSVVLCVIKFHVNLHKL